MASTSVMLHKDVNMELTSSHKETVQSILRNRCQCYLSTSGGHALPRPLLGRRGEEGARRGSRRRHSTRVKETAARSLRPRRRFEALLQCIWPAGSRQRMTNLLWTFSRSGSSNSETRTRPPDPRRSQDASWLALLSWEHLSMFA